MGAGKLSAYEEDIRVPFVIRGPGIKPGVVNLNQAAHVDIAPTLLALAGAVVSGDPVHLREGLRSRRDAAGQAECPRAHAAPGGG